MAGSYRYVLSQVVADHAFRLPRKEQQRLADIFQLLVGAPSRAGDYRTHDDAGRVLENLLIDDWVITYWVDHAQRELRITEATQV